MEAEYGKYTFNVQMPCNGKIVKIIERYRPDLGKDSIKENPETVVIYEDVDTKVIGHFSLTTYKSNHQYFGFRYVAKDGLRHLREGQHIPKGTVFLDSPSVTDDGGYKYGIQANVAMMSHPAVAEDGVMISEEFAEKLKYNTYETRVIEWGTEEFALNLYGDVNNHKAFPDIGDPVRPDGLLMALRSCEPGILAGVEQNIYDIMQVDFTFDNTVYANGPGGKVVDVKVQHDFNNSNFSDKNMDKQVQKYDAVRRAYHQKIVDFYNSMVKLRGQSLHITPEFSNLVVQSLAVVNEGPGHQRVTKLYRKVPLDIYRVEIVIEYTHRPGIGGKLTDCHGGKGVICQIEPKCNMPVDEEGNVADIVMDGGATVNRMNVSRLYEQYYNSASRQVHNTVCKMLGVDPYTNEVAANDIISSLESHRIEDAYNYLLGYYGIMYEPMVKWASERQESLSEFMATIVSKGVYIYLPPDNPKESVQILKDIEASKYRPHIGKVSYVGNSGNRVTTIDNVRVGGMYILLLEKTGDDWSSVSSAKLQHFGVIAPLTKQDKHSNPARLQGVKSAGEAEVRIFKSYTKGNFTVELMDRNNNPKTHKHICNAILSVPYPTNVDKFVDRAAMPYGGVKPLTLIRHITECAGFRFKYTPYDATKPSSYVDDGETD
jgi:hypothetical protein